MKFTVKQFHDCVPNTCSINIGLSNIGNFSSSATAGSIPLFKLLVDTHRALGTVFEDSISLRVDGGTYTMSLKVGEEEYTEKDLQQIHALNTELVDAFKQYIPGVQLSETPSYYVYTAGDFLCGASRRSNRLLAKAEAFMRLAYIMHAIWDGMYIYPSESLEDDMSPLEKMAKVYEEMKKCRA